MVAALLVLALPFAAAMVIGVVVSLFLPMLMPFTWALPLMGVVAVALFTMPTFLLLMCVDSVRSLSCNPYTVPRRCSVVREVRMPRAGSRR
jgi:hypothetical protein